MEEKVRILIAEDFSPDAELEKIEIKKTIPLCEFMVVDSRSRFVEALEKFNPHVIVSDYQMPQFDGITALKLTQEKSSLIPFILCTGSLNEDTAVECMKKGASDYIIKEHMKRLGESVKSALEEREILIHKLEAENESKQYQARIQSLLDISQYKTISTQELLDYALNEVIKITRSKIGYLYHYNEEAREFILNTWSRDVMAECKVNNPETIYQLDRTGIWGEAVRQRKSILVNNFSSPDPLKKGYPKDHVELKNFLTIPIFNGDSIVAVVGVGNKESDYIQTDIDQLTLMMDSVWKMVIQKESDLAIFHSNERFRAILNYSPIGIATIDENGFLTGSNNTFKEIFCIPSSIEASDFNIFHEEIISQKEKELLHKGKVINFEKEFTIQQLESIFQCRMNRSGKMDLEISIKAVETNPDSHEQEFLFQVEDITERKKIENIKNEFINIVSHEMRTPLTSILESMTIMKKYYQENMTQEQKYLLELSLRNINRLGKLIQDMMDFQKLNSIQMIFNIKPDSINNLIFKIMEELKTFTSTTQVQIKVELEENLSDVMMDRERISQVIINLIKNAVKFTEKGSITIKTEPEASKGRIKVSVIDTGVGISQEDIKKIFQPFYQVQKDMEHQTGGTGLGLSICKKILEGHETELYVISELGKGSTFYFSLPIMDSREK